MNTLHGTLAHQARELHASPAILAPGRPALSYAELFDCIEQCVFTLRASGFSQQARVAVVLDNGPEAAVLTIALMAGATCVPIKPDSRDNELRFVLEDARVDAMILRANDHGPARRLAHASGIAVFDLSFDPRTPAGRFVLAAPPGRAACDHLFAQDSIALVLHTSGTTGRAKLVPLTQANVLAGACTTASHLKLGPSDRGLNVMPLFHTHGLIGSVLASLSVGASVVCTPGFREQRFFEWIAQFDPTWYTASPTIHQAVLSGSAAYRRLAPSHRFRLIRSTSAALAPRTLNALEAAFEAPVVESYALTESPGQVASNPMPPGLCRPGSVGLATGASIEIVDLQGNRVPAGVDGEILVRGPGVTAGYETGPDGGKPLPDGWLHTGDQGHFDVDGYLYVSGRLKEIINRGADKVSPREVDEALLEHADVEQAAAFSVVHPTLGEDLLAAVILRQGASADGAELRAHLFERLSNFKVPSQILLVDELPRGPTGKVQRHKLSELLADRVRRAYVAPRDDLEVQLAQIWRSELSTTQSQPIEVGIDDDFFALGGDSLLAVSVFVEIERRFAKSFRLSTLFDAPTIRALAKLVRDEKRAAHASTLVAIQPKGEQPPIFFMPGWGAQMLVFNGLAHALGNDQPLYAVDPTVIEIGAEDTITVEEVAARVIGDIRRVQACGPYHLAGYSMGAKYVWEIAQQLTRAGEKVSLLALLDCPAPGFPIPAPFVVRTLRHLRYALKLGPLEAIQYVGARTVDVLRYLKPALPTLFQEGPAVESSALVRTMQRSTEAMLTASRRYLPAAYPGSMVLIRAGNKPDEPGVDATDPLMGWGRIAKGGVVIRTLGCRHVEMLHAAYSEQLAGIFNMCMRFRDNLGSIALAPPAAQGWSAIGNRHETPTPESTQRA